MTINSGSVIKIMGPNSEDNHVNVNDLNIEHIFYPRSSSSSKSTQFIIIHKCRWNWLRKQQKQKPLKTNWKGGSGRKEEKLILDQAFFFSKITFGAWSTVEKRWEGVEFFFSIVIVLFAAEGLEPISQQLFEIILKTIKQTSSLLSASLTAVLFKWGFQYKRPVVPCLRDI